MLMEKQSPEDGAAVLAEEERAEEPGPRAAAGAGDEPREAGEDGRGQREVLRPLPDGPRTHHQPRRPVQVVPPARLQSVPRVQCPASRKRRHRNRLGVHRLL